MYSTMPVCFCRAVPINKKDKNESSLYECPIYRTEDWGNTFITTAMLKSSAKFPPRKWILGGVAMLLDIEGVSDEIKENK